MNLRICTGFLTHAADAAHTPPAPGAASVRKLLFDLHVRTSGGVEFPEKCVVEDAALQKAAEPKLLPGAYLLVEAEPVARPFMKQGIQTGWSRELVVRRIEFIRVPKAAGTESQEEKAA
jgi:hypothetical protein